MSATDCEGVAQADLDGGVGCTRCPMHGTCEREVAEAPSAGGSEGTLRGWSFAEAAAGYFLIPLILACAGAMAGSSQLEQCSGAALGFGVGTAITTAVANRRRISEEAAWSQH